MGDDESRVLSSDLAELLVRKAEILRVPMFSGRGSALEQVQDVISENSEFSLDDICQLIEDYESVAALGSRCAEARKTMEAQASGTMDAQNHNISIKDH